MSFLSGLLGGITKPFQDLFSGKINLGDILGLVGDVGMFPGGTQFLNGLAPGISVGSHMVGPFTSGGSGIGDILHMLGGGSALGGLGGLAGLTRLLGGNAGSLQQLLPLIAGGVAGLNGGHQGNPNATGAYGDMNKAMQVALQLAQTDLVGSDRNSLATFRTNRLADSNVEDSNADARATAAGASPQAMDTERAVRSGSIRAGANRDIAAEGANMDMTRGNRAAALLQPALQAGPGMYSAGANLDWQNNLRHSAQNNAYMDIINGVAKYLPNGSKPPAPPLPSGDGGDPGAGLEWTPNNDSGSGYSDAYQ